MTTPRASWPLNQTGNVTLDASGNGTVQLRPDGPQEHWSLALASFKTAQTTITNEAQCRIYIGPQVADQYFVDGTLSGSTGDSTGKVANGYDISRTGPLPSVWAVWTGGDPGAIATLSISGTASFGQGGGIPFGAGEGCSNPIIGGGGALVYPSIHSPNYSAGPPVTGWSINKNGSFSFGAGGTITGPLKIFNSHGAVIFEVEPSKDAWFLYADTGSAVQGALLIASASAAGTDDFGNSFAGGLTVYGNNSVAATGMAMPTGNSDEAAHAFIGAGVFNPGAAGEQQFLEMASPEMTGLSANDRTEIQLAGSVNGSPGTATGSLIYVSAAPSPVTCVTWDTNGVHIQTVPFTLASQSTPSQVAGETVLYSDLAGILRIRPGLSGDTNQYWGAFSMVQSTTIPQTINSTVAQNINGCSFAIGAGRYAFRAKVTFHGGTAAGTANFSVSAPSNTGPWINASFNMAGGTAGSGAQDAALGPVDSPTLVTTAGCVAEIEGELTATASGTLQLQCAEGTNGDTVIIEHAHFWLFPLY